MKKTWSVGKRGWGNSRSRVAGATCQRTALPGHPGSKMQAVPDPRASFLTRGLLYGAHPSPWDSQVPLRKPLDTDQESGLSQLFPHLLLTTPMVVRPQTTQQEAAPRELALHTHP